MSKYENWPYHAATPTVYYYVDIHLYPITDASTWPFPVRAQNGNNFKAAMLWLFEHNIDTLNTVDYGLVRSTQVVHIKFTSQEDIVAFKLIYGDLIRSKDDIQDFI